MNVPLVIALSAGCGVLFVLERLGLPTTLNLEFKGDIKRETRWLAQYGQSVCTPVAALLVWSFDPRRSPNNAILVVAAVLGTSVVCLAIKRLLGRVRPGRENAGKFLGPSLRHANYRESFPSSHSACAVALSTVLAALYAPYPGAQMVFWGLAVACALLRYLLDAHWPSDVLGGSALGYVITSLIVMYWPMVR